METIKAIYRIVTPMFIGGADQTPNDGVRGASFKGALRFWWRGLNWGHYRGKAKNDEEALKALHEAERKLFGGGADEKKKTRGQGSFLLSINSPRLEFVDKGEVHPGFKPVAGARYLAYGLMGAFGAKTAQLDRGCIEPFKEAKQSGEFTVKLVFKKQVDESIAKALVAIGLLGGLGSRTRRGMGSIALASFKIGDEDDTWKQPETAEAYRKAVEGLFTPDSLSNVSREPPFTAFGSASRIECLPAKDSCYNVLDDFGKKMLDYRSWGRSINGVKKPLPSDNQSEERFVDDHHWFRRNGWRTIHPGFHPERVAFGLPHNYDDSNKVIGENHERRSSPLLFHVHKVGSKCIGVAVYLPAQFLPDGEKIEAGGSPVPCKVNKGSHNDIIADFLDGKVGNPATTLDRFPGKVTVLP